MGGLSTPGPDRPRNGIFPTANKHPSDSNMVEFVVTLKSKDDLTAFYNDMEDTSSVTNLPDRKCECRIRRGLSRNTHYWLTRVEAAALVNDSRVEAVEEPPEARGAWKDVDAWTQTSTKFAKSTDSDPEDINWAIARMREKTNPANWGSPGTGSDSYDITRTVVSELSGKNVDVVVMDDGGPYPNTLEYAANADGSGVSRMIRRDWDDGRVAALLGEGDTGATGNEVTAANANRTAGTYSGIYPTGGSGSGLKVDVVVDSNGAVGWPWGSGSTTIVDNDASYGSLFKGGENYREGELVTIPDSQLGGGGAPDLVFSVTRSIYSYENGHTKQEHGAHCTGNVAGNTQGWARDANIYNLTYYDDPQYVLKFHKEKPVNPETGRPNPTVMNNSWGYRLSSWDYYKSRTKQIIYRGTNYSPLPAGGAYAWGTWTNIGAQGNRTAGTYTVSPTGGTGSNLKFEVEVKSDGSIERYSYEHVKYDKPGANYGSGYTANDSLTIPDSQLGGGGAPDVTFTLTSVSDDSTGGKAIWSDQTTETVKMGTGSLPNRDSATDADFADLVDGGVVVIASAGNSDFYIADGPTDPDWDNKFIRGDGANDGLQYYYHRGSSPGSARGTNDERVITIGAMGAHNDDDLYKTGAAVNTSKWSGIEKTDYKAEFSNFGPGIVVWAPGCAIQSTWRGDQTIYTNAVVCPDPRAAALGIKASIHNNFMKCMGTSMSGPNACGMFACLAERYPNMTTSTAIKYVKDFCPDTVQTTNNGFAFGAYGNHPTYNNYYVSKRNDDTDLGYAYNNASSIANAYLVNHRNTETGGQAYPSHDSLVRSDSGTFASHKVTYPRKVTKIRANPPYTYALSKSGPTNLDNETDITVTLTTTNVPDGTKVPYVITSDYKDIGVRPFMYQNLGLMQIHDSTLAHTFDWNKPFAGMHHKKGKQWKINMAASQTPVVTVESTVIPNFEFTDASSAKDYAYLGGTNDYGTATNGGMTFTLPWSIPIFGTNQTDTHWSQNGFVTFGTTAEIDENNALDVAKDIIFFNGFANANQGWVVRGEVSGTAPNRVYTVYWWSAWASTAVGTEWYFTFKENDTNHIYAKMNTLYSNIFGDKDETNMWPTLAYGPQRDFYWDENDGYFTVNSNTATTKLKKMFPVTVSDFNLVLKLAHFGGEQITIPTDPSYTFRFYMDNYIQNTTGNMQGYNSWRYLNNSEDRRHQHNRKYSTNPFASRSGRTIWMKTDDTMIIKTTGNVGTATIQLSTSIGGAEASGYVSNNSQDNYTFSFPYAGEYWLCEPSQGTIHDAIRVFVYGKYAVQFTSANTTNGFLASGRDASGPFTTVYDKDILIGIGDTLVIDNQAGQLGHPIRISATEDGTIVAPEVTKQVQGDYRFTPTTYGVWYYNCTAHTGMGGRIIVAYDAFKYQEDVTMSSTPISIKPHPGSHWEFGEAYANKMYFDGKVYQKTHTQKPFRMTIGDYFRFQNQDSTNHPMLISDTSNGNESRDVVSNWQGNYWFAPQRVGSYFLRSTGSNPPPEIELVCELPLYQNRIGG